MGRRASLPVLICAAIVAIGWIGDVGAQTGAAAPPPAGAQTPATPGRGQAGRVPVVIGPSAPVPPQVAMLRPNADELAQVNAAVQSFIDADTSAAREVLKKYESLLMLQPPRLNTAATFTQTVQRMGPRHEGFVEIATAGNIDLLLHGDSITDWWVQNDDNRQVFAKYFKVAAPQLGFIHSD